MPVNPRLVPVAFLLVLLALSGAAIWLLGRDAEPANSEIGAAFDNNARGDAADLDRHPRLPAEPVASESAVLGSKTVEFSRAERIATGRVVSESGEALVGARIFKPIGEPPVAVTNAEGRFELMLGTYERSAIRIVCSGYIAASIRDVVGGLDLGDVVLRAGGSVTVRGVDSSTGAPVVPTSVTLLSGGQEDWLATAELDGRFTLHCSSGTNSTLRVVEARADGYVPARSSFTLLPGGRVRVQGEATPQRELVIPFRRGGDLRVRVRGGDPVIALAGALVQVHAGSRYATPGLDAIREAWEHGPQPLAEGHTASDGTALLADLPVGKVWLEVSHPSFGDAGPVLVENVLIRRDRTEDRDVFFGAGGSISGTVRVDSGEGVAGAFVAAVRRDGWVRRTTADSGGQYRLLSVPSGAHQVLAWRVGESPTLRFGSRETLLSWDSSMARALQGPPRFAEDFPVQVAGGAATFDPRLPNSAPGSLSGSVSLGGEPMSTGWVQLSKAEEDEPRYRTNIRTDGSYEFSRVEAGEYSVWAPFPMGSDSLVAGQVRVRLGESSRFDIEGRSGPIRGTVLDSEGRPLDGAFVEIVPPLISHDTPFGSLLQGVTRNGRFELLRQPAGEYRVRVRARGHVAHFGSTVRIGADPEEAFQYRLERGGWIRLTVAGARPATLRFAVTAKSAEQFWNSGTARPDGDGVYWMEVGAPSPKVELSVWSGASRREDAAAMGAITFALPSGQVPDLKIVLESADGP